MSRCTHPHFAEREVINVYAAWNAMTCVEGASLLGMRDMSMAAPDLRPDSPHSNSQKLTCQDKA